MTEQTSNSHWLHTLYPWKKKSLHLPLAPVLFLGFSGGLRKMIYKFLAGFTEHGLVLREFSHSLWLSQI